MVLQSNYLTWRDGDTDSSENFVLLTGWLWTDVQKSETILKLQQLFDDNYIAHEAMNMPWHGWSSNTFTLTDAVDAIVKKVHDVTSNHPDVSLHLIGNSFMSKAFAAALSNQYGHISDKITSLVLFAPVHYPFDFVHKKTGIPGASFVVPLLMRDNITGIGAAFREKYQNSLAQLWVNVDIKKFYDDLRGFDQLRYPDWLPMIWFHNLNDSITRFRDSAMIIWQYDSADLYHTWSTSLPDYSDIKNHAIAIDAQVDYYRDFIFNPPQHDKDLWYFSYHFSHQPLSTVDKLIVNFIKKS